MAPVSTCQHIVVQCVLQAPSNTLYFLILRLALIGRYAKKKILGERDVSSRTPRRVRRGGVMPYSPEIPLPCCAKIGRIQYAEAVFSRVYCLALNRNRVRLPSADVGHEDVFHGTSLEHDFLPLATHSAVHRLVRSLRDAQPRVVCCALRRD